MPTPTESLEPAGPAGKEGRRGLIHDFLTGLSFPVLFLVLVALFLIDAVFVDPVPFVDEAILGTLAVLLGTWRKKRHEKRQKNEPPPGS